MYTWIKTSSRISIIVLKPACKTQDKHNYYILSSYDRLNAVMTGWDGVEWGVIRMVEEGFGIFHRLYTNVLLCETVAVCVSAVQSGFNIFGILLIIQWFI